MRALIFVILVATLYGCAASSTTPVRFSESIEVPEERRFEGYKRFVVRDLSEANVIVVRDKGFKASWSAIPLYINGIRVAKMKISESVALRLPLGDNLLGITQAGYYSEEAEKNALHEQVLDVEEGETYYFRLGVLLYDGLLLQQSSQVR